MRATPDLPHHVVPARVSPHVILRPSSSLSLRDGPYSWGPEPLLRSHGVYHVPWVCTECLCPFTIHTLKHNPQAKVKVSDAQSCLILCNSMDFSPPGLLCPWDSPGKNTGVGCHFLLQRIFWIQGWNPRLLFYRRWGFWEVTRFGSGPGGEAPTMGLVPTQEDELPRALSSHQVRYNKKSAVCNSKEWSHENPTNWHHDPDSKTPQWWEGNFCSWPATSFMVFIFRHPPNLQIDTFGNGSK